MIIKPKVRGFICTTAHPLGCEAHVREQIDYVQSQTYPDNGPRRVLVLGCSTGYGLAARIVSAFGFGADTMGVMFEKPATEKKTGSAGWYNTRAFEREAEARSAGRHHRTFNLDAFSDEAKEEVVAAVREEMGQVDLVVYSLAAPRRKDPVTGEVYSSVLKPIGEPVTRKTLNTDTGEVSELTLEPANQAEIDATVKVMGGEDWERWIDALDRGGVLADGVQTTSFTYIGKELTWPIYGHATIGKAKEDLDRAAAGINAELVRKYGGSARVSVLKALVTQASSAIPVMPLYISLLYRVMKDQGSHEEAIHQLHRLLGEEIYGQGQPELDDKGRVRVDLPELADSVQQEVERLWAEVTTENLNELSDFRGYQEAFFHLFGFGFNSVDYDADVDPRVLDART